MGHVSNLLGRYIGDGPGQVSQREAERLTEALGEDANGHTRKVTQATISLILLDRSRRPNARTLRNLTDALGIDEDEMAEAIRLDGDRDYVRTEVRSDRLNALVHSLSELTPEETRKLLDVLAETVSEERAGQRKGMR